MNNNDSRIVLENEQRDFVYKKSRSNLNITKDIINLIDANG